MSDKNTCTNVSEIKITGVLIEKGVRITEKSNIDQLSQRGYGRSEKEMLELAFYEALYLLDKELLEVKAENGRELDFQSLLQYYEKANENAWVNYLVYRDLRSRGYVVREGFGRGTVFRAYARGAYGKDTASYMILSIQEGKPLSINDLEQAMHHCQSEKKKLILAVMNRRGEIVYYSVSQLTFK